MSTLRTSASPSRRASFFTITISLGVGLLLSACGLVSGLSDLEKVDCADCQPDGSVGADGGDPARGSTDGADARPEARSDAATDGAVEASVSVTAGCKGIGGRGPALVKGPLFCIDATEVTNTQYTAFLAAKDGNTSGQPFECSWNIDYRPVVWPVPSTAGDAPVVSLDWCDAKAFCAWAGKRLCGRIGTGATPYSSFADPNTSQWMHACSKGGERAYPYGATYDGTRCVGSALQYVDSQPVGSAPQCVGGYPGVFDMSGNVYEWEDSCAGSGDALDLCRARGGSYRSGETDLRCNSPKTYNRSEGSPLLGFRCCSELDLDAGN